MHRLYNLPLSLSHCHQSMWAERERSGKRSGAGRKLTWTERGLKNKAERERSGSRRSSERERSGERPKSAAKNPLLRKTTNVKKLKSIFKVIVKLSVQIKFITSLFVVSILNMAKEHHLTYAALWS